MKMTITESDKKLLSFLAAFLIAVLFIFGVFKPLSEKSRQMEQSAAEAKEQELIFDSEATLAQDMSNKEENMREQTGRVLARFYPMLQSQEVESMATTLMLNHHLSIQSLSIAMPEMNNRLRWYQYSEAAMEQAGRPASEEEASEKEAFFLYSARVICVAEGNEQDIWDFIDDVSENYPAISITSVELSDQESPAAIEVRTGTEENNDGEVEAANEEEQRPAEPMTVRTDGITIGLEIFMCNQ